MLSHFNDTGFWMFKEYFNLSIKQTFMTWTVMECIIGAAGLIGVLILNLFDHNNWNTHCPKMPFHGNDTLRKIDI